MEDEEFYTELELCTELMMKFVFDVRNVALLLKAKVLIINKRVYQYVIQGQ